MLETPQTAGTIGEREAGARLTAAERRALLEDIGRIALVLGQSSGDSGEADSPTKAEMIAASPARRPRVGAITSPLERLHLLDALWREMQPALAAILRGADTRLIDEAQSVSLAQARGGAKTATVVARSPPLAAAWQHFQADSVAPLPTGPQPLPPSPNFGRRGTCQERLLADTRKQAAADLSDTAVLESRPALSANTWANRLTTRILTDFARECAELARLAAFCAAAPEAETALRIARTARNLRGHPTLRDCPPLASREAAPELCADRIPRCALPYQALYGAWRQSACPLDFDWTHSPLLTLPALEPWHLYEIWCLLQTAAALHQAGWKLTRGNLLQATPRGLRLVPATGRASRLDFEKTADRKEEKKKRRRGEEETEDAKSKIENRKSKINSSLSLYYQPLFSSANQQTARSEGEGDGFAFGSRSHAMQPDMVLHWGGRLYILDPKFRPYAQMADAQEDVNKMHAYRDAIVRRDSKSRPTVSPVEAAWCLFPGPVPGEVAAAFEEVYAYPAASPEHPFGAAGVGALKLRPGDAPATERLAQLLAFLLT